MSNLPMNTLPQHHYPRLRGYQVGDDGEVTVHLCLGLPCCGLDLLIEHPRHMTALELYQIAGEFAAMTERMKRLEVFQACSIRKTSHDGQERNGEDIRAGNPE